MVRVHLSPPPQQELCYDLSLVWLLGFICQNSSVGQSARLISGRSSVQITLLVPRGVVQWLVLWSPKPAMRVRVLPPLPIISEKFFFDFLKIL